MKRCPMMRFTHHLLMLSGFLGLLGSLGGSDQDVDHPYAQPVPKAIACRKEMLFRCKRATYVKKKPQAHLAEICLLFSDTL